MSRFSPRRLQHAMQQRKSLPEPSYRRGTPSINGATPTPATLVEAGASPQAVAFVGDLLANLTPSEETASQQVFYRGLQEQFGSFLRYADLNTVLWGAATILRPSNYLEIGVRRGRSAAVVGAVAPGCSIYGFDLWQEVYFADPNLGPDFVRDELRRAGHRGTVELVSGNSAETLPAFMREHTDAYFDIVTIDGAKAFDIVASDYANALGRVKVGGIVVTDDIAYAPALGRIWHELVGRSGRFIMAQFSGAGGVSAAIRFADEPWQSTLRTVAD
jgi:predicted O-methyltransferase YrrM